MRIGLHRIPLAQDREVQYRGSADRRGRISDAVRISDNAVSKGWQDSSGNPVCPGDMPVRIPLPCGYPCQPEGRENSLGDRDIQCRLPAFRCCGDDTIVLLKMDANLCATTNKT